MAEPLPTRGNAPKTYKTLTPNNTILLQGWQWLRAKNDGDLIIKGCEPDAVAETIAVTAGEYFPFGAGYLMVGSTAAVLGIA